MDSWMIKQTWEHLMFIHWEAEAETIRSLIPRELELDLFEGRAWVTILPFKVTHQRLRFFPELPLLNHFLELNVRTYVRYRGIPGVYFFSLDANHPLAVMGAKAASLPFRLANIEMGLHKEEIVFKSKRTFGNVKFSAVYEPLGKAAPLVPGSLDSWLLERYTLFSKWGTHLLRGDICHESWKVNSAKIKILENTVAPVPLNEEPKLFHYSLRKEAFIFPLKKPLQE